MHPELTAATIIRRNESRFLTSNIGNEIVMMDLTSGNYVGLNSVSGDIWEKLSTPHSITDLISMLLEEYEVEASQCERETFSCLQQMLSMEIVEIV